MSLTSAKSITQASGAPRGVYLDYPLGQTAGRADDLTEQKQILEAACAAFENITEPGGIIDLPMQWSKDDAWKDVVMRPKTSANKENEKLFTEHQALAGDQRTARHDTPQYQHAEDASVADPECSSCVFLPSD